ncbi:predicted protein [Histoplasma capsulatum G186AR]|uniref:Uncharacterized protein n=1 Tax=Ajellomyces capsulatus (strain G186AR / H82 / ATCC MYA-2454 / RMSCC 2432) TaxID=447093 RepID=C0P173_AJECG|nr:uncharacterized protein HCBG_09153 [Histoplasma capsulatum G186AR]EEH02588.1 predicted protein [Histoplasma capsulatum G186AR]
MQLSLGSLMLLLTGRGNSDDDDDDVFDGSKAFLGEDKGAERAVPMHSGMKIPALKDNADDLTPTFPFQFFSRSDEQRRQERLVAGILYELLDSSDAVLCGIYVFAAFQNA